MCQLLRRSGVTWFYRELDESIETKPAGTGSECMSLVLSNAALFIQRVRVPEIGSGSFGIRRPSFAASANAFCGEISPKLVLSREVAAAATSE